MKAEKVDSKVTVLNDYKVPRYMFYEISDSNIR